MKIKETRFQYAGIDITFTQGDDVMVNATEMAKVFNKKVQDWTRLDSTKVFLQVLDNQQNDISRNADNQLINVVRGGLNPGTWMHEDVALEFARWLSPEFGVWCNARIKELITIGTTAINPEDLLNPDFVISAMEQLKESRAREAEANAKLAEQKPKVEYFEDVVDSSGLFSLGEVAKTLGVGRNDMMSELRRLKILMKNNNGNNVPYQSYINQGYFKVKTSVRNNRSCVTALVTPKGTAYIKKKLEL